MFTHPDGTPIRPDWLTGYFAHVVEQLDLPPTRLHDLRHAAASLAGAGPLSLVVVGDAFLARAVHLHLGAVQIQRGAAAPQRNTPLHVQRGDDPADDLPDAFLDPADLSGTMKSAASPAE